MLRGEKPLPNPLPWERELFHLKGVRGSFSTFNCSLSFFRVLVVLVVLVKKSPPPFGRAKNSASERASAHAAGGGDGGQCRCDCCHDDL